MLCVIMWSVVVPCVVMPRVIMLTRFVVVSVIILSVVVPGFHFCFTWLSRSLSGPSASLSVPSGSRTAMNLDLSWTPKVMSVKTYLAAS
jgi:hypothetical protein